jgi:hypothetical protein
MVAGVWGGRDEMVRRESLDEEIKTRRRQRRRQVFGFLS